MNARNLQIHLLGERAIEPLPLYLIAVHSWDLRRFGENKPRLSLFSTAQYTVSQNAGLVTVDRCGLFSVRATDKVQIEDMWMQMIGASFF
jgi:hypothetical protein